MSLSDIQELSLEQVSEIDDIVSAFEDSIGTDEDASIEDALRQTSELLQPILLLELIGVDIEVRGLTQRECLRDYVGRFPQYEELILSEFGKTDPLDSHVIDREPQEALTPDRLQHSGEVQFGRYRVTRHVGRGGMADVFFGSDSLLDRNVAIKVPLPGVHRRAGYARFLQEARTMAQVQHANVCPVLDVGIHGEQPFISMNFINGAALDEYLRQHRDLTISQIVQLFCGIAQGVEAAHDAGVLHRDLKPSNVIVDTAGTPIVTDFGFSGANCEGTEALLVGSPAYMSPEQASGQEGCMTVRSDVYSLGAMLAEMLSGRRLYSGNVSEVLKQVRAGYVPEMVGVPPRLETVCRRAMSFEPGDRYESVSALAEAVHAQSRPTPASRKKLWLRSLVAAMVLAALLTQVDWPSADPPRPARTTETVVTSKEVKSVESPGPQHPMGLNPGDHYHIAFITAGGKNARSTNIDVYNSFATTEAKRPGSQVGRIDTHWLAMVSTELVDVAANTNTAPAHGVKADASGQYVRGTAGRESAQTGYPIYLVDGRTVVARSYDDLWDGTLVHSINVDQFGKSVESTAVWTGSAPRGHATQHRFMGSDTPRYGNTDLLDGRWLSVAIGPRNSRAMPLYVISGVLTVPDAGQ